MLLFVVQLSRYRNVQSTLYKLACSTQGYECTADSSRWAAVQQYYKRVGHRLYKMQKTRISMMLGSAGWDVAQEKRVQCRKLYIGKQKQLYQVGKDTISLRTTVH
jgi:hypothetical protein